MVSHNFIDRTGDRYGRLVVIGRAKNSKKGRTNWVCVCDCGNEVTVLSSSLQQGNTRSCGCLRKEKMYNGCLPGECACNLLQKRYKENASKRGLVWGLTRKQFCSLTQQYCHYCGSVPMQIIQGACSTSYVYNGIDRVDSGRGYLPDNTVSCCKFCNWAKNASSVEEFEAWLDRIVEYRGGK
jgi:hypothetical protein